MDLQLHKVFPEYSEGRDIKALKMEGLLHAYQKKQGMESKEYLGNL